jgi:hypothetical protein
MTMPPEVWGPIYWATIHITALSYPEQPSYPQKRAAKEFFKSLAELIPCPMCRKHYSVHLKSLPIEPHLDNRTDLVEWTLKLHNKVNVDLGKPTYTREQFLKAYEDMCQRGLPVPPSPFVNKIYETADSRAYMRGIIAGSLATLGFTGVAIALYKSYGSSVSAGSKVFSF